MNKSIETNTPTQNEFYLYDRDLFDSKSTHRKDIPPEPLPEPWHPDAFPTDLSAPDSLKAWQTLFKQRRTWASSLLSACKSMCAEAELYLAKRRTIENGLRVATSKHEGYLGRLAQQQGEAQAWFEEVKRDAGGNIQMLEEDMERMSGVPVIAGFGKFFGKDGTSSSSRRRSSLSNNETNLASFVDVAGSKRAAEEARAALEACEKKLLELGTKLAGITSEYEGVVRDLGTSQTRSLRDDPEEPKKQLQEVQAIANKVASDYEHVMGLQNNSNSLRSASKMALLHTKNFLPNLRDCAIEMDELLRYLIDQKNSLTTRSLDHLQTIARVESSIPPLRKAFDSFELPESGMAALDRVATASQLPITYGSLLIEAAKRKEWVDKMKHDSAALAEEIAGYQEEETRRRRKWMRGVANMVQESAAGEGKVLSVEVNLQGEDVTWPAVTRTDIEAYISNLSRVEGFEAVVESLSQTLKSMDAPTRQQVKRAKAFKMGSVHEASGFGRGSLMLRGDDEAKILREANVKLEDEAKGYKQRIKKLEDLLHKQSLTARLSLGGASQSSPFGELTPVEAIGPLPVSPRQQAVELHSRRSSTSSRRVSFTNQAQAQPGEDRNLARRIVQLEADLVAARDQRARLEKAHQTALDDVNSTKRDLLENMEAQQREFAGERRSLEDELERVRGRIEELEDEFDRLAGSRENDKTGAEARFQVLLAERDDARREAGEKVRAAQARSKSLERNLRERSERDVERVDLLKGLHEILDAENAAPEEPAELIAALEALVQREQDQRREVAQAIALARSENGNLQAVLDVQKAEAVRLQEELEEKEGEIKKIQDELRTEQSKAASIAAELENEREHLRDLREKFAEGETGSESLRQRLEEEQEKASKLSTKLAETRSHVNSLDVELLSFQTKHRRLQDLYDAAEKRLQERAVRAKAVSQRLYTHNDRLMRLLQTLGFVISFEDGKMKLERASKAGAASTVMSETGTINASLHRTISGSTTTRWIEDLADVSLLLWAEKDLPKDEETRFAEFMDRVGRFNLDIFAEAITKRMRDMEHTARKWQRETRSYRDKAHRLSSEAHDKIAFRAFKEGDLALFLPTRNQAMKPWAAFNIGAPHYFLREQDGHKLVNRDWLVARISRVEERVVDLSKALHRSTGADDGRSITEASDAGASYEDDNPFDLSDGLRWYLLDAQEEKVGAPTTPGLGKAVVSTSTVSATRDDSKPGITTGVGAIKIKKKPTDAVEEASKALSRSLDSRRSSHSSKKGAGAGLGINTAVTSPGATGNGLLSPDVDPLSAAVQRNGPGPSHLRTASDVAGMLKSTDELQQGERRAELHDEVRRDLLFGP
jgi:autophagy-related protein 11